MLVGLTEKKSQNHFKDIDRLTQKSKVTFVLYDSKYIPTWKLLNLRVCKDFLPLTVLSCDVLCFPKESITSTLSNKCEHHEDIPER